MANRSWLHGLEIVVTETPRFSDVKYIALICNQLIFITLRLRSKGTIRTKVNGQYISQFGRATFRVPDPLMCSFGQFSNMLY